MLASLFPAGIVVEIATPAMWEGDLLPAEQPFVAAAVPKRRHEFTAGRCCARAALARLGIEGFAVRADADRVPVWPDGVVGSISHTDRMCAVAVGKTPQLKGIGLDLEVGGPLPADVSGLVCLPGETDGLPAIDGLYWDKVLFSAKEAFYKAVFPIRRAALEFDEVAVQLDAAAQTFRASLVAGSLTLSGRFAWNADHVATGVTWST